MLLAGGSGTRFWPRSTPERPKQCLVIDGERSLIQQTVDRLDGLVPTDRVLVVTGREMFEAIRQQLPELSDDQFIVEPSARNTGPAIALAALEVEARGGQCMVVLPTDHRIADHEGFRGCIRRGIELAAGGVLVLLAQSPTRAEPGFGYIELNDAGRVTRFTEKPDAGSAAALIDRGALWNGGMFVWTIDAIRGAYQKHLPGLWGLVATDWQAVPPISVDRGILERAENAIAIRCDVGWSDLGSWRSAGIPADRADQIVSIDAPGNVIDAPGRRVVVLGISDLVIVDTGEILMVIPKDQAHRVDELRSALNEKKADHTPFG